MKQIKDFIYDKNDIFVALIIVCVAAFVIVGRIDAILAYPSSLSEGAVEATAKGQEPKPIDSTDPGTLTGDTQDDAQTPSTPDGQPVDGSASDKNSSDNSNKNENDNGDGSGGQQDAKAEKYSVYINPGSSGSQIADVLISVGLMESRQQFLNAVSAAGAESKLKAGNYIIPANATPDEVVAILTR